MGGMRLLLTAVALCVVPMAAAQSPDPATAAIVERAGRYVDAYLEAFTAVVSQELQVQKLLRPDGRVKQVRELKSDFLLVKTGATWPIAFRDVIASDGKPVKNRPDRLRKLFLDNPKTAVELARAIARESERFNIGLQRSGNSPLLPLIFLTTRIAPGVRYAWSESTRVLTFEEFKSPSVMSRRKSGVRHDLMARGSFEIEPETGRVLAAELNGDALPGDHTISLRARYEKDSKLDLSVPIQVDETYRRVGRPDEDRLEVLSTYSAFRRFDVTVGEQIKVPKSPQSPPH
jgi:hypothetical protein